MLWPFLLLGLALSFPPIPQQYSVTVAINHVDLGYTITYNEFFDGLSTPNGTLYTEGRYGDTQSKQIVDYNTRIVTEWNSDVCYQTAFSQLSSTLIIGPSTQLVTDLMENRTSTPVFVGTVRSQSETRGILCDKWTSSFNGTWNDTTVTGTISYYFASNQSFFGQSADVGTVPVRVWFVGSQTKSNSTTPFERVFDWVSFNHGVPPGFVFKPPAVCSANKGSSLMLQAQTPSVSTVGPEPSPNASAPAIATNFRMLVERKIREDDLMMDITTINWWRDRQHKAERVDLFKNNLAQSVVYIYQTAALYDGPGYVYNNTGTNCLKLAVSDRAQCASASCVTSRLTPQNINPIFTRDGGFARYFDNGTWFAGARYVGRSPARGVTADVWSKDFTLLSPSQPNVVIAYTQSIYFFPQGWQFPGRNVSANTTFPLRMINEGSVRCLGTGPCNLTKSVQFSDMYDIYQFVPGVPSADSMQQPCPSCFDGIQNQGEAGVDCGSPCAQACQQSPDSLPFPSIAKSYLVSVSANIIENGYTMSYNEYYDATYNNNAGALLTEGFFGDLRQLQLIDYKTRMAYRWTPGDACVSTALSSVGGFNATYGVGPSSRFFTTATAKVDKLLYWGVVKSVSETRGILCNKWETLTYVSDAKSGTNYSLTYYFAVTNSSAGQAVVNSGGSVPIRVVLKMTRQDKVNPALEPTETSHTYDWTDWQNVKPPSFLFVPPACSLTTNLSRFDSSFANLSNAVVPEPRPNSINYRPFPQAFRMVVEAKLTLGNASTKVWSANWFLASDRERVDLVTQGSTVSSTFYYEYKTKSLWDGPGIVDSLTGSNCYKIAFRNAATCQSETCVANANTTANNSSPILRVRDGGFARLFGPDKTFFSGSVYVGRKLARGINADVFMKQQNRTLPNGDLYSYFQSVYYFPEGWQFPGRPAYSVPVPLRVIHEGVVVSKGVSTPFYDMFDIFQLRPGTPPQDTFFSRCPDPLVSEQDPNTVGKVIGGLVIAAALLSVILGLLRCIKKRRAPPAATSDMQL